MKAKLSVVIATLGGVELEATLERLQNGSRQPDEILICLPEGVRPEARIIENKIVKIIYSQTKGQVAQRITGFNKARFDYVLQLDDDIELAEDSIELLLNSLQQLGEGVAVAPALYFKSDQKYVYSQDKSWLGSFFDWIINGSNGFESAKISKAGVHFPIIINDQSQPFATEWFPGACVLHHKQNLVKENYYPFSGKAYAEDLYHSFHLTEKDIRLFIIPQARAFMEFAADPGSFWLRTKDRLKSYRAQFVFTRQSNHSLTRLMMYYFIYEITRFSSILSAHTRRVVFFPLRLLKRCAQKMGFL